MRVLGIETSCDETGVAVYDDARGLLAHALHSQVSMHEAYGGVVPEIASRDHIRRVVPLTQRVLSEAGTALCELDGIAYTRGPGLAGALLVGATIANALGLALSKPVVGVHHLEGHLLSPLLAARHPGFPFIALLVSGGHTQLFEVTGVGSYRLLGDTQDDAAGEAFDKTAKLLGLGYPGGPALAALAASGRAGAVALPRPMIDSGDLDMSFSGLKTAVLTLVRRLERNGERLDRQARADIAREFEQAIVDVLVAKAIASLERTNCRRLVVAGGVGANRRLHAQLVDEAQRRGCDVYFPDLEFCTDNGAMIALVGALRLCEARPGEYGFSVRPRWDLASLRPPANVASVPDPPLAAGEEPADVFTMPPK